MNVMKLVSLTVALFLAAAPVVRAFAAAPLPSREFHLVAPHGTSPASLAQRLPHLRRPKLAFVAVLPSSGPQIPAAVSRRCFVPDGEFLPVPPTIAGLPDHPPA